MRLNTRPIPKVWIGKFRCWVAPNIGDSNGKWTYLQAQPGFFPAGHFGPEITFARDLLAVGYRPAIFKFSSGGTSLAEDWKEPGENGLYDHMVSELRTAIGELSKQGYQVNLRAMVWIQGENDAKRQEMADGYFRRLTRMIVDFRQNVAKMPNLLVILGVDEQHPWVQAHPEVVTAQKQFANQDGYSLFTSMKGLAKADPTHLTPCGLQAHGEILFAAYVTQSNALPKQTKSSRYRPVAGSCIK